MTYNQEDKTLEIILGESREITVNTSSPRQLKRKAVYSDAIAIALSASQGMESFMEIFEG